ncbi:hypothetical protein [Nonlabens ponticola]|uniref:Uncharacterized protein n=1 Tax=Nonlabens ponticola TaxID=2496866 RepID=A0A3S9MWD8_9FLAO|nr:hypothetical protein [Nonlabens ponticola]AZQ43447.1 hypothetical protein EJ995_04060 [Nonlabens ponticola]
MNISYIKYFLIVILAVPTIGIAQVGIQTVNPQATLDISSTDSGILIPRVALSSYTDITTVVNPDGGALVESTLVYNNGVGALSPAGFYYWSGTQWIAVQTSNEPDWKLAGNSAVDRTTDFLGTTDANPVVMRTDNTERLRLNETGQLLIGLTAPRSTTDLLQVASDVEMGGGAANSDGERENISIQAQSAEFILGVQNEATLEDSYFGLYQDDRDVTLLTVQSNGFVSIGEDDIDPNALLHITRDQEATTAVRIDNTERSTDVVHTALQLWDGSTQKGFFRHNNFSDVLDLGHTESDGIVNIYAGSATSTTSEVALSIDASGDTNISNDLKVLGTSTSQQYVLSDLNTAPASATAPGIKGEIRVTTDFIYVCIATNTWVRSPLSTW